MGVGIRLKQILRSKKMTIKQLSECADIPLNTLYSITKRDSKKIDEVILQRIAGALDISLSDLTNLSIKYDKKGKITSMAGYAEDLKTVIGEDKPVEEIPPLKVKENICQLLNMLNSAGQQKAVERIQELTEIPKYQRMIAAEAPVDQPHDKK